MVAARMTGALLTGALVSILSSSGRVGAQTVVEVTTPMAPPAWALMERDLLDYSAAAIQAFYDYFYDDHGYLLHTPRWGTVDGTDDALDTVADWPLLHSMGAPEVVLELFRKAYEGHLLQYKEVTTKRTDVAEHGAYYRELLPMSDFFHQGEALRGPLFWGLSEPAALLYQKRMRRFAGFYTGADPEAPNYDRVHKVVRSHWTGSRGPMLRDAVPEDWVGEPLEGGRFHMLHSASRERMQSFDEYYPAMLANRPEDLEFQGDHPLNLAATNLALHAYMLRHEAPYRDWILEYVGAWAERTRRNGGNIPTNVGLDGAIGGEFGGRWYKGNYGWNNSRWLPEKQAYGHWNTFSVGMWTGFGNAYLLTGDEAWLDVLRKQTGNVFEQAKVVDGTRMIPFNYGEFEGRTGWYNYRPATTSRYAFPSGRMMQVYLWSMDRRDLEHVNPSPWIAFLDGENDEYPEQALAADFEHIRRQLEAMRDEPTTPDTRLADWPMRFDPATVHNLFSLTQGGYLTGNIWVNNAYLRYFDPRRNRAGLPEDVAALVTSMDGDGCTVVLINLNPVATREVVVQTGGYGEHRCLSVTVEHETTPVGARSFTARLSPGAGAQLAIAVERYANQPTLAFPWHGELVPATQPSAFSR